MDRRLLAVPGVFLLLFLIADVGLLRWQATLHAGPGLDGRPPTHVRELPAACRDAAVALADGRTVSVRGFRVAPDSVDLAFERASVTGEWTLGDANCADRLSGLDNLRVDGRSYGVLGEYSQERVDRTPAFGLARLGTGLVGVGLLAVGLLATLHGEVE
ncbi:MULTISPECIES: hypothetical protein [Halorubrum]|uniref:Uncharacterized protein n=1 Tax=Halorubrum hochstenium ATCC 700873 TaxID=1227481 RepID=M0F3C2_9EURY|nr:MULTISPECIES: hypothetical protein [Halorubrum]ELZ54526.1 hypothetical protein C467_11255 [Halorubrum hochstenium ATCC 700873]